ncbi:MAG TPA: hypothetical protein VMB51_00440 [Solirubrobacteraceae bacterium]|nr:hypothetical protein [Solirubrobacteraceae bacterium]
MITAILITAIIVGALAIALRSNRHDELSVRRPYNNRYNAASGARDDSFD